MQRAVLQLGEIAMRTKELHVNAQTFQNSTIRETKKHGAKRLITLDKLGATPLKLVSAAMLNTPTNIHLTRGHILHATG
jgi:hypothetical protein